MEADLPDWSALDHDLLGEIAVRTSLIEDFMAFRGVCSSWRGAASKNRFKPSSPRVPLLVLPEKEGSDDREFYSLSKKKICMRLSLPQLKGRNCVEARFGWILTLASSGEVSLFNPLSGAQMEVPNYRSFPYSKPDDLKIDPVVGIYNYTRRAVLSSNPSDTSNFVLMVLLEPFLGLGIWRAGGKSWMALKGFQECEDIACYNDKFYGVRIKDFDDTEVWVWDPFGSDLLANIILRNVLPYRASSWMGLVPFLVESSDGKLVLITLHDSCGVFRHFDVTTLDVLKCQWKTITGNLEDDVVFLGRTASVSVAASAFPNVVKPNRIYFTHDGLNSWLPSGVVGSNIAFRIFDFELGDFDSLGSIELGDCESIDGYTSISGCDLLWIAPSS